MITRLMCWLGLCMQCEVLSTQEGIGGQCVACGEVHGWVTREELREYAKRATRQ